jgi:zinc protease
MRAMASAVLVLLLLVGSLGAAPAPHLDQPLPTDPALTTGTLSNGLAYVIRPHKNPEGRVSVWLHVASGSLNETEATRGLAHYLEHVAFNGSANFPPGSVVPFFQSLGLSFGRDQNAFTSLDQTVYQLALPDTRPETLDKALLFLSDVASRLTLPGKEIDAERQIVLEERRARAGVQQRISDYVYERLAPESTLGRRLPIGTEATIQSVNRQDFVDYYTRWYTPSNMTVIVVGEIDPAAAAGGIAKHFGAAPAVPRPTALDAGVKATSGTRAIVATDAELTRASVAMVRVEPSRGPTLTVGQRRRDAVDHLGTWMFNRRMNRELAAGQVAFSDIGASIGQWYRAMRTARVEASGKPEVWPAMLADLGVAVQRARLHGFSDQELDEARTAFIAEAEQAVQREATLPARSVLRQINAKVARGEPISSAAQSLAILKQLLPGITAAEVSAAFAANFDVANAVFIAELPSGTAVPTEAELAAAGRAAVSVQPAKALEVARATSLLAAAPRGGVVVESVEHAASGVTSARLDNGVRVHHRFMDQRKNEATVAITLAGGVIQEDGASRGITEAAAQAWERPATSGLSSPQIESLMTGKKVRVTSSVGGDALTLTVAGNPADLEAGLQLAYLLLTDPVLEPAALEQWKEKETQAIAARKREAWGVLEESMAAAFYPREAVRLYPLTADQVRAVSRDAAQAWLRRLVATAPIEVAVVGDVDRATALGLVSAYLGALPARDPISDKTLAGLRAVARPAGPLEVKQTVDAAAPQAVVLEGFFGADMKNLPDVRRLAVAARLLSTRMHKTIREEKQLVYSIGAGSRPAVEYPGFGLFVAQAPTDPAKTEALAAAVDAIYADFAAGGPGDDELAVARKQMLNAIDQALKNPEFWVYRLGALDYRGTDLTELMRAPQHYGQMTAAEIREAFNRYFTPTARLRFVVVPAPRS